MRRVIIFSIVLAISVVILVKKEKQALDQLQDSRPTSQGGPVLNYFTEPPLFLEKLTCRIIALYTIDAQSPNSVKISFLKKSIFYSYNQAFLQNSRNQIDADIINLISQDRGRLWIPVKYTSQVYLAGIIGFSLLMILFGVGKIIKLSKN